MHSQFNPQSLLGKPLEISYWKDSIGEDAEIIDIGNGQYKIVFKKAPEDDEQDNPFIWTNQKPESIKGDTAFFSNIGATNFYLKIKKQIKNNMKVTVKELSEKLGIDIVYVNGFLQTLIKMGKASVVGKVEKPAGTRGKPSNIYEINGGIVD